MANNEYQKKRKRLTAKYQAGFLARLDGRLALAQELNSAFSEIVNDMGGQDSLSHTQLALAERFVFLEYVLRKMENAIATNPKKANALLGKWVQGLNSLVGLARTIGLERRARKIESLETYVLEKQKHGKRTK